MTEPSAIQSEREQIRAIVQRERAAQGLYMREFGAALGVSHNAVAQWENGIASPADALVASWCESPEAWIRRLGAAIASTRAQSLMASISRANSTPATDKEPSHDA